MQILNNYLIKSFNSDQKDSKFYKSLSQCKIFAFVKDACLNAAIHQFKEKDDELFIKLCK